MPTLMLSIIAALLLGVGGGMTENARPVLPDTIQYIMMEHPDSGADIPQIIFPHRPDVEERVNASLDSVAANLQCSRDESDFDRFEDGDFEFRSRVEVKHTQHDVFSLQVRIGGYCGGAYPLDGFSTNYTFDLRTGNQHNFSDLFVDFDEDRKSIAEPIVEAMRQKRKKSRPETDPEEDDCLQNVLTMSILGTMYGFSFLPVPDEPKLKIRPTFPRVALGCITRVELPLDLFLPYARPDGLLEHLAEVLSVR